MRRRISLYIAGQPVDLDEEQSFILFNYTMEDMGNPTIVRNSFSQQVTIKGTPNNNRLFGGIWRSDRVTQYGDSQSGIYFDATQKTPFTIYNEMNEILEEGYCKLDSIQKTRSVVEYTVSLYGGLGSFFFSLSYSEDGEKRTLADLLFTGDEAGDDELDFVINAQAVTDAWDRLRGVGQNALWDIINFCPAYNGLPSGTFDADKAIFSPGLAGITIPDGYSTKDGLAIASFQKKFTEWEVKDLRSYLQRPVIKMSKIIEAICQDYNNGGYEVILDQDFFNANNPYYDKVWLTLPVINTLDLQITETSGLIVPSVGSSISIPGGGNPSTNYTVSVQFDQVISIASGSAGNYYLNTVFNGVTQYFTYFHYVGTAYDSDGNVLQTKEFNLATTQPYTEYGFPVMDGVGHFSFSGISGANAIWVGDPVNLQFNAFGIHHIVVTRTIVAKQRGVAEPGWTDSSNPLRIWPSRNATSYSEFTLGGISYINDSNRYTATTSSSARSGSTITKRDLLSSDKTPADYLLSYCKQFGLVFLYDKGERRVSILQKKSFYLDNVIDLTGRVDISQPITMLPYSFDCKWYNFSLPYENGEYAKYYANIYDRVFGLQRVNTGYGFNADSKNLLEGIVFRGATEVLENSKYFVDIVDGQGGATKIPSVFLDSGKYTLADATGEAVELTLPQPPASAARTWWDSVNKTYDFLSKLQFHNAENASYEERDTLVFFNGMKDISAITDRLGVTDDTTTMMALNDNTPCWILDAPYIPTMVTTPLQYLPVFSRYIWDGATIDSSLDFGTPEEVNIPDVTFATGSSMYEAFWQNYIRDRYDDDSRVMTCKVNLSGFQVNEGLLRNFYYYDGCIWAMNKIINYSLTTYDDVECEFIKVQDKDNYLN